MLLCHSLTFGKKLSQGVKAKVALTVTSTRRPNRIQFIQLQPLSKEQEYAMTQSVHCGMYGVKITMEKEQKTQVFSLE